MKVIVFYIYLCFTLLFGGNNIYADTCHITTNNVFQNLPEKQQINLSSPVKKDMLIESTDISLDEEFHNDDNHTDEVQNKFLAKKYNFSGSLCLNAFSQITSKEYVQRIKIFTPFCGYSSPIYIRQQVLRI